MSKESGPHTVALTLQSGKPVLVGRGPSKVILGGQTLAVGTQVLCKSYFLKGKCVVVQVCTLGVA